MNLYEHFFNYHPTSCRIAFTCVWFGNTLELMALAKKRQVMQCDVLFKKNGIIFIFLWNRMENQLTLFVHRKHLFLKVQHFLYWEVS